MTQKMLTTVACVIGFFAIQAQGSALAEGAGKPPTTDGAANITQNSATLSGTFYSGKGFASMGWGYKPMQGIANCGPLPPTGTQSCVAKPLKCGTTYYYTATTAENGTGQWKEFKTLPCK